MSRPSAHNHSPISLYIVVLGGAAKLAPHIMATDMRNSLDPDAGDEDIEMRDTSLNEGSDVDAEGEPEEDGDEVTSRRDLRQLIQDVSTYLCEVEEG